MLRADREAGELPALLRPSAVCVGAGVDARLSCLDAVLAGVRLRQKKQGGGTKG